MRHALVVFAVVALAAPLGATAERAAPDKVAATVLAIESGRRGDSLVRVDARSLRRVSKRLALPGRAAGWSFSPDGRRVALGVDGLPGVVIVDLRRMKPIARVRAWHMEYGGPTLVWATPRRIIAWERAGPFVLDPVARKIVSTPRFPREVLAARRAGNRLVLLSAPPADVGPAEIAVMDAAGRVETVVLDRIRAGWRAEIDSEHGESYQPALVVDPTGRVFVLGGKDEPIAEVDLHRLELRYHWPERSRSLLTRFRDWLEPVAHAKAPQLGSFRRALWLGDGKIAVWGYDGIPLGPDRVETKQVGVYVVDTQHWSIRTIDAAASGAAFAGDTLLTWGEQGGLTGFTTTGDRRYRLFDGDSLGVVATFDSRAFVAFDRKAMHVVEAPTGEVLGTARSVPRLLHPAYTGW